MQNTTLECAPEGCVSDRWRSHELSWSVYSRVIVRPSLSCVDPMTTNNKSVVHHHLVAMLLSVTWHLGCMGLKGSSYGWLCWWWVLVIHCHLSGGSDGGCSCSSGSSNGGRSCLSGGGHLCSSGCSDDGCSCLSGGSDGALPLPLLLQWLWRWKFLGWWIYLTEQRQSRSVEVCEYISNELKC